MNKTYNNEHKKKHYKQFNTRLKPDEYNKVVSFLIDNELTQREFILIGLELMKKYGKEIKNEKDVSTSN